jgi:hypothetical protein
MYRQRPLAQRLRLFFNRGHSTHVAPSLLNHQDHPMASFHFNCLAHGLGPLGMAVATLPSRLLFHFKSFLFTLVSSQQTTTPLLLSTSRTGFSTIGTVQAFIESPITPRAQKQHHFTTSYYALRLDHNVRTRCPSDPTLKQDHQPLRLFIFSSPLSYRARRRPRSSQPFETQL